MRRKGFGKKGLAVILAAAVCAGSLWPGVSVYAKEGGSLSQGPEEGGGEGDFEPAVGEKQILEMKQVLRMNEVSHVRLTEFGSTEQETFYNLQSERSEAEQVIEGRPGRKAWEDGWFSYTLPVKAEEKNYLTTVYYGTESQEPYDILVNGDLEALEETASDSERTVYSDGFYSVRREIPQKYLSDPFITVKFVPKDNSGSALYGLYLGSGYDKYPELQDLSFDIGEMDPAFQVENSVYTVRVPRNTDKINMTAVPHKQDRLVKLYDTDLERYVLVDDEKAVPLSLSGEKTEVLLKGTAEDHSTERLYTVSVVKTGDKSQLKGQVQTAEGKVEKEYTKETWSAMAEELKAAKALLSNKNATQTEINSQVEKLRRTIENLKKVPAADTGRWITDSKGSWFRYPDGTYPKKAWKLMDGKWYYFDETGYVKTGWFQQGKTWYYSDTKGVMQINWKKIGGVWYYFNGSGAMVTGWQKIGGTWYYFNGSGAMLTNWQKIGGIWYYMNGSGAMATGWQKIGGIWYYFNESGAMKTGWQWISGRWYYMNGSGAMLTGWQKLGGIWYYFSGSGSMATGWQKIGTVWYYFNGSGAMLTGWQKIGGSWYYLSGSGAMLIGWQKLGGKWYYFNHSGAMQTGWLHLGGAWYYLYESGQMAVSTWIGTSYVNASGVWIK